MPSTPIHWEEGLFLQQHHLQRWQKDLLVQFGEERHLSLAYDYGVIEAVLNEGALRNKQVKFDRLHLVMPDGTHLKMPDNMRVEALPIAEAFVTSPQGFMVYLALPNWASDRPNVVKQGAATSKSMERYVVGEPVDICDENDSRSDRQQPVTFRFYNARLELNPAKSGMTTLPLLRLVYDTASRTPVPRCAPDYVHPCLMLNASEVLLTTVAGLAETVWAARDDVAAEQAASFNRMNFEGGQLTYAFSLSTLNRFGARLRSLMEVGGNRSCRVPPFQIYQELLDLFGELAALFPEKPFNPMPYKHEDPLPCFRDIVRQISECLPPWAEREKWEVPFRPERDGGPPVARLQEKHFQIPKQHFLQVRSTLPVSEVMAIIQANEEFKVQPPSYKAHLFKGLNLAWVAHAPGGFPKGEYISYYRVVFPDSNRLWEVARDELALELHWIETAEVRDFQCTLCMPLPPAP